MKIVFDANVIISAFLIKNSLSSIALNKVKDTYTILASSPVLDELRSKLPNKKFDRYLDLPTRISFVISFEKRVALVSITERVTICRDPKDNMYLELALSGAADYIITGDQDLLVLNPFKGINIITPKDFLNLGTFK